MDLAAARSTATLPIASSRPTSTRPLPVAASANSSTSSRRWSRAASATGSVRRTRASWSELSVAIWVLVSSVCASVCADLLHQVKSSS